MCKGLEVEQFMDTDGYMKVVLYKNGKGVVRAVHELVAEAFIPNPHGYKHVRHIDGNRRNNCADNLEWVRTRKEQ